MKIQNHSKILVMKRINNFFLFGLISIALLSSCKDEGMVLTGYRFEKERAVIETSSSDDFKGDLTIDMYIMLHSYPKTWTGIISKFKTDYLNEFNLRIKDKDLGHWYFGAGDRAFVLSWDPSKVLPLNEWVRLTAIRHRELKCLTLLINGEEVAKRRLNSMPLAAEANNNIVLMALGKSSLDATLAEVRIWNKALNIAEINSSSQPIKKPTRDKNLVGYWRFNSVKDGVVSDLSEYQRDAKISKVR